MKMFALWVAALFAFALAPSAAQAAAMTQWYGRDSDGDRYRFVASGGGNWDGTFTLGGRTSTVAYQEVKRTGDYIQVQIAGDSGSGVRIYGNRLEFWSRSRGRWVEICRGRWTD